MTNGQLLNKSVTRGDLPSSFPRGTGLWELVIADAQPSGLPLPQHPPAYWTRHRDYVLRSTVEYESMWASAVSIAITKMAALSWWVQGPQPRLRSAAHDLFHQADLGGGWVSFLSKHLQDFLCTDNGAFIEIVRASKSRGARILGIRHLDSTRCRRTGDVEIPVIYTDRHSVEHELRAHQVLMLADMPNPGATFFGVGRCAASRAYRAIYKLAVMEQYIAEKMSGSRPQAIYIVNGITQQQLGDAVAASDAHQAAKKVVAFRGAVVVPVLGDVAASLVSIPLAELPDGFNRKEEWDMALLTYANAIGLDPQDLQPLTGQALGTGAQSQVLDDKSGGRGLAAWRQQFTHAVNEWVTPASLTFGFSERDLRDRKQQADVEKVEVDTVNAAIEKGVITAVQGLQQLVDRDVFPEAFLSAGDTTPVAALADGEKPQETVKEASAAMALIEDELAAAQALYREMTT